MSIASAINNLKDRIEAAYAACESKNATIPQNKITANLPETISSINSANPEDIKNLTITKNDLSSDSTAYIIPTLTSGNSVDVVSNWPIYYATIINDIIFVSTSNGLYYSTNTTNWNRATFSDSNATTIKKIIYVQNLNKYFAILNNTKSTYYYYSDNGTSWTKDDSSYTFNYIYDITSDEDNIIVSMKDKIIWSNNLTNWNEYSLSNYNYNICYGDNKYVLMNYSLGTGRKLYYSSNLSTWTQCNIEDISGGVLMSTTFKIQYLKNKFLFIGFAGIFYSADGITWTKSTSFDISYFNSNNQSATWTSYCMSNNNILYCLIGSGNQYPLGVATSTNGEDWSCYKQSYGTAGFIFNNRLYYGDSNSSGSGLKYIELTGYDSIRPFKLNVPTSEVNIRALPCAGTMSYIPKSSDVGFSKVITSKLRPISLTIDPTSNQQIASNHSDALVCLSNSPGIYNVNSYGYAINSNLQFTTDINFHSITKQGDKIFAASNNGIYYSNDNGITWNLYNDLQCSIIALSIITSTMYTYLLAARSDGIYYSYNNNFTKVSSVLATSLIPIEKQNSGDSNVNFLIGTNGSGIYYAKSNGSSINQSNITSGVVKAIHSAENGIAVAGIGSNGIYRSTDYGITWEQTSQITGEFTSFCSGYGWIFAGSGNGNGIYKSTNDGLTWTKVSGTSGSFPHMFTMWDNYNGMYVNVMVTSDGKIRTYRPGNSISNAENNILGQTCCYCNGVNQSFLHRVIVNPVTSSVDSNIQPENIKKDVTILGVTGTLEASNPYIIRVAELPGYQVSVTYNNQIILTDTTSELQCDLEFQLPSLGTYTITATNNVITWSKIVQITDKGVVRVKGRNLSSTSAKDIYDSCCYGISSKMFSLRDVWTFTEDPNSLYYNEKFFITEFFDNGNGTESVQFWACDDKKSPLLTFMKSQYIILSNGSQQEILKHNGYKYSHLRLDFLEKDSKIFTTISGLKFSDNGTIGGILASNELKYHNNKNCDLYSYNSSSDSFTKLNNYQYNSGEPLYIEGYITPVTITETEFYNGTYYTKGYADGNNWNGNVYNTARTYNSSVQYYGIFETLQEDGSYFKEFRYLINNRYLVNCTLYQRNDRNSHYDGNIIDDKIFIPSVSELFGLKYTYTGIGNVNRTKKYFGDSVIFYNKMWTGIEYPDCFTDRTCFTRTLSNVQNSSQVILLSNGGNLMETPSPTYCYYSRPAFRFGPNYIESESESYPESWNESWSESESYPESGYESWSESESYPESGYESGKESIPESWNESYPESEYEIESIPESWNESESYPESWNESESMESWSESESYPDVESESEYEKIYVSNYSQQYVTMSIKTYAKDYPLYPYDNLYINSDKIYYSNLNFVSSSSIIINFIDKYGNSITRIKGTNNLVYMDWNLLETRYIEIYDDDTESESWNESESYPESEYESWNESWKESIPESWNESYPESEYEIESIPESWNESEDL